MDKVSMSLDDIIKSNRKGPNNRPNKNGQNRNNNSNQFNNNNNGKRVAKFNSGGNQVQSKQFGMLNKSKAIQKRQRFNRAGFNRNLNQNQASSAEKNIKNRIRRRRQGLKNRLNNGKPINNLPSHRLFNRFGTNRTKQSNKTIINRQQQRFQRPNNRQQPPKRGVQSRGRIAMQAARKNVQKAKRLLANRRPTNVTQRFSSKFQNGNIQMSAFRKQRKAVVNKQPVNNRRNNNKMIKVNINNKKIQTQQKRINKPFIRRNRAQQQQQKGGRMVFY